MLAAAVAAWTAVAIPAPAATLIWASDTEVSSLDPYARQETFLLAFDSNIYEPLVRRDRSLRLEPALALSWTQTAPMVWRFRLRQGVKFQDGTPFGADDVLFSFDRVRDENSNLKSAVATVAEVRKIDDFTVDFVTATPDPILPGELANWDIMSKAWCEAHDAVHPPDLAKGEESYATGHANGTGPFMPREGEAKTMLVPNPLWWDKAEHGLDAVDYRRIANPAARVAALLAGEVDAIYPVPPQELERISGAKGFRLLQTPELRTIFLGFDQSRPELLDSDVKAKNPFKDRRVRQAFYLAIDETAISERVMREQARPAGIMVAPGVNGYAAELDRRFPYDPETAKRLLAEAGYPRGFTTGMDCPNDRYVNDEQICLTVVAMLARIGVRVNLLAQPRAKFFAKVLAPDFATSFYMLAWTPATYDAENTLVSVAHTRDVTTLAGSFNVSGYSNPTLDVLIDAIQVEADQVKRTEMIRTSLAILRDDFAFIPLHQQTLVWGVKDSVRIPLQADNRLQLRYVTVK